VAVDIGLKLRKAVYTPLLSTPVEVVDPIGNQSPDEGVIWTQVPAAASMRRPAHFCKPATQRVQILLLDIDLKWLDLVHTPVQHSFKNCDLS